MTKITITKQVRVGESVSIQATPVNGYAFDSYSGNINGTTTGGRTQENGSNPLSFNATTDSNIDANFKGTNEGRIEIRWYNSVNEPGYGPITRTSASLNATNLRGVRRISDYGNAINVNGTLNSGKWTGYYVGNIAGFAISDISSVGFREEGGTYPGSSRSNVYYADFSACTSMTQFGNSSNNQQFYYHNTIETVKLPSSIESIYFTAFAGSNIKTLYIYATTPPSISGTQYSSGDIIFSGCSNLRRIYVPAGSVNAYKSATAWSYYSDKITAIIDVSSEVNPVNSGTVSKAASETSELSNTQSSTLDGLILTASGNSGYSFSSWKRGATVLSSSNPYTLYSPDNINGTDTIIAEFLPTYAISASVDPSGSGTISGTGTYNSGDSVSLVATAETGYEFVNWTEGGTEVSTSASYSFTVNSARTLVANFQAIQYTISASASPWAGGTVSGGGSYNYGDTCTLRASFQSGYVFSKWTENGTQVSTSSTYSFTVSGNRTLVAVFTLRTYTISASASPSGGGTVSGAGTKNHGSTATLVATANTGYVFSKWTENGTQVSTSSTYSFTVSKNRTLVAVFTLRTYSISASVSPSGGGSVSGTGYKNYGTTATLVATPNSGYSFLNWTEGGTEVSTDASYSFTVSGARTLVANFQQIIPITITTTGATTVYLKNNSDQTYTWNLTSGTNTYYGTQSGFELSNLKSIYKYSSTPSDSDYLITSIDISGTSITNISERSAWGACRGLTSVIFPETITTFGREAFWNCSALANITLPASVSSIGRDSFNGCTGLSYIRFKGSTVPSFLSNSFSNTNNCTIYVPSDAVDTYKAYSSIADRVQAWPY